jgi:hypothetical protein
MEARPPDRIWTCYETAVNELKCEMVGAAGFEPAT